MAGEGNRQRLLPHAPPTPHRPQAEDERREGSTQVAWPAGGEGPFGYRLGHKGPFRLLYRQGDGLQGNAPEGHTYSYHH